MRIASRSSNNRRRGVAAMEFAVCLPVLVTLVFGSFQACDMLFLKHAVTTAAYEGTLAAAKSNATTESVCNAARQVLTAMNVHEATVSTLPLGVDVANVPPGEMLTVVVNAPVGPNLFGPVIFVPSTQAETRGVTIR
ncbi:TadE-like protein [Pirellulimonas nuda]|uniref:TadE-like protein n=1 Tax=Pirellulimonas nuda TaxID=2528009 RepID=A0A518D9H4_9BACT|nr:TadE family protein [Pirellulimonas nuda]QDU88134.1 TadE-like protein [Pirellulimonas nuda]